MKLKRFNGKRFMRVTSKTMKQSANVLARTIRKTGTQTARVAKDSLTGRWVVWKRKK